MTSKMTLAERCRAQSRSMDLEGWYVAANVLWEAAEALDKMGYEIKCNLPFDEPPSERPPLKPVK